jgi:hypothetical protein
VHSEEIIETHLGSLALALLNSVDLSGISQSSILLLAIVVPLESGSRLERNLDTSSRLDQGRESLDVGIVLAFRLRPDLDVLVTDGKASIAQTSVDSDGFDKGKQLDLEMELLTQKEHHGKLNGLPKSARH